MTVPAREPIKVLGDILKAELGLDANHILLENQKFNMPQDPGLFVSLSYVSGKPVGNNNFFDGDLVQEVQETVWNYLIQIDVMSADATARTRKEEVVSALRSVTAQNALEAAQMSLGQIPISGFINAGMLEETARLNRYTMTVAMKALFRKVKTTPDMEVFPAAQLHYSN